MSSFVDDTDVEQLDAAEAETVLAELTDEPSAELAVPDAAPFVPDLVASPDQLAIVPPEQEMRALVQLAVTLSAAELVPRALRDRPNDVLLVLLTARDLGIKLTTSLRLCYPIEGQVTLAPKLRLALVRERGVARVWPDEANDHRRATWYARRLDDPEVTYSSTMTWEDALRPIGKARLLDQRCLDPDEHVEGCGCKDNWRNYPAHMLKWRAIGYLLDDCAPEVGNGCYSPDELGAVTDEDGVVVLDVMEAAGPLDGTAEPRSMAKARRKRERAAAGDPAEALAPEPERELFGRMLRALPDDGVAAGVELWPNAVGLRIEHLTVKKAKAARALIDSLWKRAEGGEWGPWERPFDPDAEQAATPPDSPSEAPESESGPESAPDGSEALSEPQSGSDGGEVRAWDDIEQVIDHVQQLDQADVDAQLLELGEVPEGDKPNDRRRALAVRLARDCGLL